MDFHFPNVEQKVRVYYKGLFLKAWYSNWDRSAAN